MKVLEDRRMNLQAMTETDYARKLDELDRLLNDPDVPMQPGRVWSLLAEIAQRDLSAGHAPLPPGLGQLA
jgi:hypothetical protein